MRILAIARAGMTAAERPIQWALNAGHEVVLLTPAELRDSADVRAGLELITYAELDFDKEIPGYSGIVERQMEHLVRHIIDHFHIDIIHQYFSNSRIFPLKFRSERPMIVSIWGMLNDLVYDTGSHLAGYFAERLADDWWIDALIVESPLLRTAALQRYLSIPHIVMIPIGVDPTRFHGQLAREAWIARHRYGIPEQAFVFLSPRGWASGYQHHLVLDAFADAYQSDIGDSYLAFVGLPRERREQVLQYKDDIRQKAENLGVAERIVWIPRAAHEEMPSIYALSDAVINFPEHDAFGATLQEALACGRPVISADLPTYHDTPLHSHLTLVPPGDVKALAAAMVEAIHEPASQREARTIPARQMIFDHYAEQDAAAKLLALYHDLLEEQRPG